MNEDALGSLHDDVIAVLETVDDGVTKSKRQILNGGVLEILQHRHTNREIVVSKSQHDAFHCDGMDQDGGRIDRPNGGIHFIPHIL